MTTKGRRILLMIGIAICAMITGCAPPHETGDYKLSFKNGDDYTAQVLTDPKTGCEYIYSAEYGGGLAPLLSESGKPAGCHKVVSP